MELIILFIGFIGSWALFTGSIHQAAIELNDEDIEIDRIRAAGSRIVPPPKISTWWWIVPPMKFYKEFKRSRQSRAAIMDELEPEDINAMISFNSKAKAWLFVAFGGVCLAIKETYELVHYNDWNELILILLTILMFGLSIVNVVVNMRRAKKLKKA
jgi:hypothetical protein